MNEPLKKLASAIVLVFYLESVNAVEFEKLKVAVAKSLGATKVKQTSTKVGGKEIKAFYTPGANGKATKYAVIQQGIYPPNCTHTWVVGMTPAAKVAGIRVVEMSCTHAYPTREKTFLDQFTGKGPAEVKTLKAETQTIAKATGSSELTADAVVSSILTVAQLEKATRSVAGK